MTVCDAALLWASAFGSVLLLVAQSRFVHAGRYAAAACGSFAITAAQLVFVRAAAGDVHPALFLALAGTAGPCGVVTAMWLTRKLAFRRPAA